MSLLDDGNGCCKFCAMPLKAHEACDWSECYEARIAQLEKVAEAAAEWFGPSLQDARFETVAVIKALREAGYRGTTKESGQ